MKNKLKIVVTGGSGLIGRKVVNNLREQGHEVVAASPSTGVNALTGEGLTEALKGAHVVVDVANSPNWEDQAVLDFFETSSRNLLAAEARTGVRHHVALSVVGTERLLKSGYFRAKMAQENLITASAVPYTIVRATQFFEFVESIAKLSTQGNIVRLPATLFQPMAADDVAAFVAEAAVADPVQGMIEIAGPEALGLDEAARQFIAANDDPRTVITDPSVGYYGIEVDDRSLTPGAHPRLGATHFADWLSRSASQRDLAPAR